MEVESYICDQVLNPDSLVIMGRFITLLLMLCLISETTVEFSFAEGDAKLVCTSRERQALLSFKGGLVDPSDRLSSWTGEDCCLWMGIQCKKYNSTKHVVRIDLRNPYGDSEMTPEEYEAYMKLQLSGEINSSLLDLKYLRYLDLSLNDFEGKPIPEFIGSLKDLRYLGLSRADFAGIVPPQLGNLTKLYHLDIGLGPNHAEDLQWLSNLSSLQYLDLSGVDLGSSSDWLQIISTLPSLLGLRLRSCNLSSIPSLTNINFTSLELFDLSQNNLNSSLPDWLFSLNHLVSLDLSSTHLQGPIPCNIQNFSSLEFLNLFDNNFNSSIPDWIFNLTGLKYLDLSSNFLQGSISPAIGNLTLLEFLNLSQNHLEGEIPKTLGRLRKLWRLVLDLNKLSGPLPHELGNFKNLDQLSMSFNLLTGSIPMSIGKLSSLRVLQFDGNNLNGTLPETLGQLSKLQLLSIGNNSMEGVVTETHFANLVNLTVLEASDNLFRLNVHPGWVPPFQVSSLQLRSWQLRGKFPQWLQKQKDLLDLDISNTGISGHVPSWFWNISSNLYSLNLSHNQLQGELPSMLYSSKPPGSYRLIYMRSNQFEGALPHISCDVLELDISKNSLSGAISPLLCNSSREMNVLRVLVLSDNLLSGELSECWMYWQSLEMLKLNNNNFNGTIPGSIGSLYLLKSLHLENNSLQGELPSSLQNCRELTIFDLGGNKLSGSLPAWIGNCLIHLMVLRFHSNKLNGDLPPEICSLSKLQVLDISQNTFSGNIPRCFGNFQAMTINQNSSRVISYSIDHGEFVETLLIVFKENEAEISKTLRLVTSMDLSCNELSGEIPEELPSLFGLRWLNLSNNYLTGNIPEKIGSMGLIESLDLSVNKLSGVVPQSMSSLNFLSYLNLSYNNLSGRIPSSTQLQSFSELSYTGNIGLCGPPLEVKCRAVELTQSPNDQGSFYVIFKLAFVLGFGAFWFVLVLNKSRRNSYCGFLDDKIERTVYSIVLKKS